MNKFKVGDKVRLRADLVVGTYYNGLEFKDDMPEYVGKPTTITVADTDNTYKIAIDKTGHNYWYGEDMLEKIEEEKEMGKTITFEELQARGIKDGDILYIKYAGMPTHEGWHIARNGQLSGLNTQIEGSHGRVAYPLEVKAVKKIIPAGRHIDSCRFSCFLHSFNEEKIADSITTVLYESEEKVNARKRIAELKEQIENRESEIAALEEILGA